MAIRKHGPSFEMPAHQGSGDAEPHVLDGRFELREMLGSGGMATVHRAWDRKHDRPCAVKVLAENLAGDEEFRGRFRQEAEAASALAHTRIVRVYGYGEDGSTLYIAMEFVEGGTLRDLLDRQQRLPEGTAVRAAAEVADALAYAHARRVVHRDIKPQNILLTADDHVKVADFGIARLLDSTSHTRAGTLLGSTEYISPEQAAGRQADQAADQYSLGVVLYEMLAGRLPFEEAETPVAMALKHIQDPPFDLQWMRPDLSDATVTTVRRLLAKAPEQRYPSAADLATNLRRIYARLGRDASETVMLPVPAGGSTDGQDGLGAANARGATVRLSTPRRSGTLSETARTPILSSQHRRRTIVPQLAVVLVGLIGLGFFASAAYRDYWSATHHGPAPAQVPAGVRVPSLTGQTLAAAQSLAASSHVKIAVSSRQDRTAAPGVIVTQDPPPGTTVTQNGSISVVVSQGSGIVPDVRGTRPQSAAQRLLDAGLTVGTTSLAHDDRVPSGMVASQSANPGDHLAAKAPINLVLSQGSGQASNPSPSDLQPGAPGQPGVPATAPGTTVVPNVTGASLAQAQSQLRSAGLRTGRVSYTYDDRVPPGEVVQQGTAPGAQASANDAVDLVVSQGPRPAPSAPQTPSNQSPPPGQGSIQPPVP
ncbi:MAG TPA: protein kinase [bacterium]|nr:protein kinase [bacterium]